MQQLPSVLPPLPLPNGTEQSRSPERHANLVRFQSELEFVQCLSNPLYLHELHVQKYFDDSAFVNYLQYLQYWREPSYVRFIVYPTCLAYLSLLLTPSFRAMLGDMGFIGELMRIGLRHHETWRATQSTSKTEENEDDVTKNT